MAELIDKSKLMFLLEREMDMNGITDWGKGYMEAIHDAMEHAKFMETTTEAEIRAKAIDEFAEKLKAELRDSIIPDEQKFKYERKKQERICVQNVAFKAIIKLVEKLADQLKEE